MIDRNSLFFDLSPQDELVQTLPAKTINKIGEIITLVLNHFEFLSLKPLTIPQKEDNKDALQIISKRVLNNLIPLNKDGGFTVDWTDGDAIAILWEFLRVIEKRTEFLSPNSLVFPAANFPNELMEVIPHGRNYRNLKKIAMLLLIKQNEVNNFRLAQAISGKHYFNDEIKYKITRAMYDHNPKKYNDKVENCIKTIRKFWKKLGYSIMFRQEASKTIKL